MPYYCNPDRIDDGSIHHLFLQVDGAERNPALNILGECDRFQVAINASYGLGY
jgi:hypothetical protein